MKQKLIAVFILCLTCYMAASSYHSLLSHSWKAEFALPNLAKNPKRLTLIEGREDSDAKKDSLSLNAKYASLVDAANGRVLYEKSGNEVVPMASTTKIMTCILALENADLDDAVTVSKYASTMPDVQLNLKEGERYLLKDLLYSLMLESHNDSAVAIAEHVGGSVEGFAAMMNDKAVDLGCRSTNFVTPNGLDAEGHQTTAIELSRIACYAIQNPVFLDIIATSSHAFEELSQKRSFTVQNKDRFLTMYEGALGVKTGFTNRAGYCFVGAVKQGDKTFVSSVLASGWPPNKNYKWSDTQKLMDYGKESFEYCEIFHSNLSLNPIPVSNGRENQVPLSLKGRVGLLWNPSDSAYVELSLASELKAPVASQYVVGKADIYVNGELYQSLPVTTLESVDEADYAFCLQKVFSYWCGVFS